MFLRFKITVYDISCRYQLSIDFYKLIIYLHPILIQSVFYDSKNINKKMLYLSSLYSLASISILCPMKLHLSDYQDVFIKCKIVLFIMYYVPVLVVQTDPIHARIPATIRS